MFFTDIIVNFLSALEKKDGNIDCNFKTIARSYISSWFLLDLVATIPTQVFDPSSFGSGTSSSSSANVNKLLRLARLPRLYRLLRILRLFKVFKIMQNNEAI